MKKFLITGTALLLMVLAITGVAVAEVNPAQDIMGGIGIHREMYMILLSEKYAPELTDAWKSEFDRRDALMAELKKLIQDKGVMDRVIQSLDEIKNRLEKLEDKIDAGEMKPWEGRRGFRKGFENPREKFHDKKDQFGKFWGPGMDKNRELFQKFTQAVESGDETQMKTILPELFQQLKENNQKLEKQIDEMKNNKN